MNPNIAEAGKATRFKPGNRANPSGRPKTTPLTDELKRHLAETTRNGKTTHLRMVVEALVERAETGDMAAQRIVWEYIDGKPQERVDLGTVLREEAARLARELGLEEALALREVEDILARRR